MRALTLILLVLLLLIQIPLWFGKGGVLKVWEMQNQVKTLETNNTDKELRNQALRSEVEDLQAGKGALEEEARDGLGLIKPGEIFIQVLSAGSSSDNPRSNSGVIQTAPPALYEEGQGTRPAPVKGH